MYFGSIGSKKVDKSKVNYPTIYSAVSKQLSKYGSLIYALGGVATICGVILVTLLTLGAAAAIILVSVAIAAIIVALGHGKPQWIINVLPRFLSALFVALVLPW